MDVELMFAIIIGLVTVIGGGGMWLGILHNKVANNTQDIERLVKLMNGHMTEFNTLVRKVDKIEVTCETILGIVNNQSISTKSVKQPKK